MVTASVNKPATGPRVKLVKKFNYVQHLNLDNATAEYAYYAGMFKPDVTKALGSDVQFGAYELFRLKKIKVAILQSYSTANTDTLRPLNRAMASVVWTAPDYGINEIPSSIIMQAQNVKANTLSLNSFKNIVNTPARINANSTLTGNSPVVFSGATWVNTSSYSTSMYSGYQLFIQNFGSTLESLADAPRYLLKTELEIEFLQPSFQNHTGTFQRIAWRDGIHFQVLMDPNSPDFTTFVLDLTKTEMVDGVPTFKIHLKREDGQSGSLTYTADELRTAIHDGTSGKYYNARRAIYTGPTPPEKVTN